MSLVFTLVVYFAAGGAACLWLVGQGRLPSGALVRVVALIFWPAYLPLCLSQGSGGKESRLAALERRIQALPLSAARRTEYEGALRRLAQAVADRTREEQRLQEKAERLRGLVVGASTAERALVEVELSRLERALQRVSRELGRAEEGILRLLLRLEVLDLDRAEGELEHELRALEEDLTRLLEAEEEVTRLAGAS